MEKLVLPLDCLCFFNNFRFGESWTDCLPAHGGYCPSDCLEAAWYFIGFGGLGGVCTNPIDMVNIPVFSGFYAFQVVQDFFHQQFHKFVEMAGNGWKVDQLTQEFSGLLLSEGIGRSCCKRVTCGSVGPWY